MKRVGKFASVLLAVVFAATMLVGFAGCAKKKGIVIYVDGGGANGNFNTTASMDKSPANPYPYNTLETLAKEYMALHPNVKIIINKTSLNSDRETVVSLLTQKQAPHLLYQISPSWVEDAMKGWVVDLTDSLSEPNPYIEEGKAGAAKWSDLYIEKELLATRAANGRYYNVCLEKIPIGIIYNKEIFAAAGLDGIPTTYKELLEYQEKIYTKTGKNPYHPIYDWYDIFLEVSIFSKLFDTYDVIEKDGFISAEEIVRAWVKGEWGINSRPTTEAEKMYKEYFRLMKDKTKYYPEAYESYDALEEFLKGRVGMIEATGGYMAKVYNDPNFGPDKVGVFGFPTLTQESSVYGGNGVYRGTAGLCTGYCVTNRAVKDGQATVDACVDFLKFLTAPQNNNRLVNDLGLGMPISPEAEVNPLFVPLVEMYNEDISDPNRFDWNTFCTWSHFGKEYYDTFLNTVWAYQANELNITNALDEMAAATKTAFEAYMQLNGWTKDRWN